ncbi:hypothetical protein DASC09_042190 [Saccharomycopsis crataegensis]|uniref:Uncharacterized protein n=1 Tax=Saccharomycopsis crataegensis TaxID=43959 RepID=A0AAV5QQ74_9ASCO|nr:hypothetical protein DASC09_042190 [Saccharomycopsis crataegensis]
MENYLIPWKPLYLKKGPYHSQVEQVIRTKADREKLTKFEVYKSTESFNFSKRNVVYTPRSFVLCQTENECVGLFVCVQGFCNG